MAQRGGKGQYSPAGQGRGNAGHGGRGGGDRGGRGGGDRGGRGGYAPRGNTGGGLSRGGRGGGTGRGDGETSGIGGHGGGSGAPVAGFQTVVQTPVTHLWEPENKSQAAAPSASVASQEDALIQNSLTAALVEVELGDEVKVPRRPGYAKMGTSVVLRTNYFEIQPMGKVEIFRYPVTMYEKGKVVEKMPKRKAKRAFQLLIETADFLQAIRPHIATDYSSMLITTKRLNLDGQEHKDVVLVYREAEENEADIQRPLQLTFRVRFDTSIDMHQLLEYLTSKQGQVRCDNKGDIIQALNIIVGRKPSSNPNIADFTRSNKFFPMDAFLGELSGGIGATRGYYSSVRTATGRLLLNVNSVTSAFYLAGPLSYLIGQFGMGPLLNRFVKGLRVTLHHRPEPKKVRSVFGLVQGDGGRFLTPLQVSFEVDGTAVTVAAYFSRTYPRISFDSKGCVANIGNAEHPTYVPADLCMVLPGQPSKGKLVGRQADNMIKLANRSPGTNAKLIMDEGVRLLGLAPGVTDGPNQFGLNITPHMITVVGRVLAPPQPVYAQNKAAKIGPKGDWNMEGHKFVKGGTIDKWTYLHIRYGDRDDELLALKELMIEFHAEMVKYGMNVGPVFHSAGAVIIVRRGDLGGLEKLESILGTIKGMGYKLLFVVLPAKEIPLYSRIKYLADCKVGLHTVCAVAAKLKKYREPRLRLQHWANIALKVNLKFGGRNQRLQSNTALGIIEKGQTMLVGIDVTHPSPGSIKECPSIAGVVASINKDCAQWSASVRSQGSRVEIVEELREMMSERIRAWQSNNNRQLPQNIIVYRDGVSEGQYVEVLNREALAIDDAITGIYETGVPKARVAIFVVGKRHHTRFYPTRPQDMADQGAVGFRPRDPNGNPRYGTVVDRGVTSERQWDFYLQAHHGLQGTARPAHYVALKDQIKFTADGLEQMASALQTNNLCWMWGRATKAVSYCPPAYYADRLCEHARSYLMNELTGANYPDGATYDANTAPWTKDVHADLANSMFFV